MADFALTTVDNPYDPFDQFDSWITFDLDKGYNTCAYLARVARTSESLSDAENEKEINRAIDEILKYDFMNLYKRVERKPVSAATTTPKKV